MARSLPPDLEASASTPDFDVGFFFNGELFHGIPNVVCVFRCLLSMFCLVLSSEDVRALCCPPTVSMFGFWSIKTYTAISSIKGKLKERCYSKQQLIVAMQYSYA